MQKLGQNTRRVQLFVAATATLVVALVGVFVGVHGVLLVLAALCLLGAIALAWQSLEALAAGKALTLEDALGLGAPSVLEEQKQAVLRALKDLEYELGAGKVSRDDYLELSAQYRSEARRLMQELDESLEPTRRKVEDLVQQRLRNEDLARSTSGSDPSSRDDAPSDVGSDPSSQDDAPSDAPSDASRALSEPAPAASSRTAPQTERHLTCRACATDNDADALFCKKCGARFGTTQAEAG